MADQNDIATATSTYGGFITLLKWGTLVSVVVTGLVVLLIAS